MTQISVPHDPSVAPDDAAALRRERMRTTIPVAVAVALLFGLVVAVSLVVSDLVDVGVWFLTSR